MTKTRAARYFVVMPQERKARPSIESEQPSYVSPEPALQLVSPAEPADTSRDWTYVCSVAGPDPAPLGNSVLTASLEVPVQGQLGPEDVKARLSAKFGNVEHWGVDLPIQLGNYYCVGAHEARSDSRRRAEATIGKSTLVQHSLLGEDVNVVVVDQGIHGDMVGGAVCGWTRQGRPAPGKGRIDGHGAMIVRSIRSIAPKARIFDCPLVPPNNPGEDAEVTDVEVFLSDAVLAWSSMIEKIKELRDTYPGRWVIVNAWYVSDTASESPEGHYSRNRGHRLNQLADEAADLGIDLVFCAGNCGGPCASGVCGAKNRAPGQSIVGINSHERVLTVGSVLADGGMWLGYSSEGPGQPELGTYKPDLCAPSYFFDESGENNGTSAASGIAAGVVAALRSKNAPTRDYTPEELKQLLAETADQVMGFAPGWNPRTGHGVINAANVLAKFGLPAGSP